MIIKINQLTNFGNYRQFLWGDNTNFAKRNLIYGWNYSGKTTLSRLFQVLADPSHLTQWPDSQFDVELQGGARLTQANLVNSPRIKVFNRDFIQSNFQQDHKAPAIFMVGSNTIHLRKKISRLSEHEGKTLNIKSRLDRNHQRLKNELESLGTTQARHIAELTGDRTYNRTKLNAEIDTIKAEPESFILTSEALQAKIDTLRSTQQWKEIDSVDDFETDLDMLRQGLAAVMKKTASNEAINKLRQNHELESWVRTGLTLHCNQPQCEFCGSDLAPDFRTPG